MGRIKIVDIKYCPKCGRKINSDRDIYWDIKTDMLGCIYCMKDKIEEHIKWCDEWRKKHRGE